MSHAPKNNADTASTCWQPNASIATLKRRAEIVQKIRHFFISRHVLEVETPLLCHATVTDPYIESIASKPYYLQTSPEYAMKRLLAAGSGPIFQICKAFRQEQQGNIHNPEFTMLEWYQPNYDHHDLMNEMDALLQLVLTTPKAERYTYQELFTTYLALDPHSASLETLANAAATHHINIQETISERDTWLMLLMSQVIEPKMPQDRPLFVYDFPTSQAALARIQNTTPAVASRFEVYVKGIELANGFHELQDAKEQRLRFEKNITQRKLLGLDLLPIDEYFLAALQHGLPDCAGVALGVDRLVMLATGHSTISDVLSFDFTRA